MAKSKFLKNLLTTASAVAVLAGGVESASAAGQRTAGVTPANLSVGGNWDAAVNAGDAIKANQPAQVFTVGAAAIAIDSLDMNNKGTAASAFTVDESLSIGSVVDLVGATKIKFDVQDKTLTFSGKSAVVGGIAKNLYTAVSEVNLANAASKFVVFTDAAVIINANVINTQGAVNNGTLIVDANAANGATVTFGGTIGVGVNGALAAINVGNANGNAAAAIFNAKVQAKVLTIGGTDAALGGLGAAGTVTLNATATGSTFTTVNVGAVGANGNKGGAGTLISNAGTMLIATDLKIGSVGGAAAAANIGGAGIANILGGVQADNIAVGGAGTGGGAVGGDGTLTLTGAISDTAGAKAVSTITVGGADNAGVLGGLGTVNLTDVTGFAQLNFANTAKLNVINLNKANFAGGIDSPGAANLGTVNVTGADSTIQGKIGATQAIKSINFTDATARTLTIDSNDIAGAPVAGVIKAQTVNFANDGTLVIKNSGNPDAVAKDQVVTFTSVDLATDGTGAIVLDKTIGTKSNVTITGKIGLDQVGNPAGPKALNNLTVGAGVASANGVFLTLDVPAAANNLQNFKTIKFEGKTNLRLANNANAGIYEIEEFILNADDEVSLNIGAQNATINTRTGNNLTIGDATKNLSDVRFAADKTLTIGDRVSISSKKMTTAVATQGKLVFAGDSTFSAKNDNANRINTITGGELGKTVNILTDVFTNGAITINAGTMQFAGNVTALNAGIVAGVANTGTLAFNNSADITVTGVVGAATKLASIAFNGEAGKKVTFVNKVEHTGAVHSIDFTTATNVIFTAVDTDTDGVNITSKAGNANGMPVIQYNTTANGGVISFGVVGDKNNFVGIQLNKAATIVTTAAKTDLANAFITTTTTNVGKINFNTLVAAENIIGGVGSAALALNEVTFTNSGTISGDAYANKFDVPVGMTATFGGKVSGDNVTAVANQKVILAGAGSAAVLTDGASLNILTEATLGANGSVTFQGSGAVNKTIGTAASGVLDVNFKGAAGTTVNIDADIFATNVTATATTLNFTDIANANNPARAITPPVAGGTFTATDTTFALNKTNVAINQNITLVGTVGINTTLSFDTAGAPVVGNIDSSKKTIDIKNLTAINIIVDDASGSIPTLGTTRTVTLVDSSGFLGAVRPINVSGTGSLTGWTAVVNTGGKITLTQSNNAPAVLSKALASSSSANQQNAMIIAQSPSVTALLNKVTSTDKIVEFVERGVSVNTSPVVAEVINTIGDNIAARMDNLAGSQGGNAENRVVTSVGTGVSAGDDDVAHRYGVWLNPFFAKSTQKANNEAAGYTTGSVGASFGFDTRANEDMIIGASASVIGTDVKYKNYKSGDKARVNSLMFSIYGMQQINDNWFAQGVATFGSNNVGTREKRVISNTSYAQVKGDYTSVSFGGEAFFGYNFIAMDQFSVTPMLGLRYTRVNSSGYTETGDTPQVLRVNTKAANRFEGILGARVAGGTFDLGTLAVMPEVHGFVSHDMIGKAANVTATLPDVASPLASKGGKVNKTFVNLGLGLNAGQGAMEYGVAYDANLATKYVAHQGTLKIRVNF